jgi:hypothetical protein
LQGDRIKEAISINKSLSALGDVISGAALTCFDNHRVDLCGSDVFFGDSSFHWREDHSLSEQQAYTRTTG